MKKIIMSSVVAAILVTAGTQKAQAQDYAAFVISNNTDVAIEYQVKWGNWSWVSYTVQPHSSYACWFPVNRRGWAPTPRIRFNELVGNGVGAFYRTNRLATIQVDDVWEGSQYQFNICPRCHKLHLTE
jgi:hypothetical protein